MRRASFAVQVGLSVLLLQYAPLSAQTLPSGMRIVVPVTPGGPVDFVARTVAGRLAARSASTVIVENKPGANGVVAAMSVIQAPADGKVSMLTGPGTMTIGPHLSRLPFDPLRDLTPIAGVAYAEGVFVVGAKVPASNLREFVQLAAASNPPLALGSAGQGNLTHLFIERFKDVAKVDFVHVPYKGIAPALTDVVGGQIVGAFPAIVAALPQIRAGALKPLGVIGTTRSALLPQLPTMAEQGFPVLDVPWFALVGPPKMPNETVSALASEVAKMLSEEDTKATLMKVGLLPWRKSAQELAELMRDESERWGKLIREKNITE